MTLTYTVRPISDRTWLRRPGARSRSQFTASWSDTLGLLERELTQIGGRRVVLEMDVRETDLRLDGTLRANARPASSGAVVVAFESKHGPLQYRSDLYDATTWGARGAQPWQHNVRAVALTLQALRAVDRYGATSRGEQYQGYRQLGAGTGIAATSMTTDTAAALIIREAELPDPQNLPTLVACLRRARANAHPDHNDGDRARWNAVDEAEQVLRRAGRLS